MRLAEHLGDAPVEDEHFAEAADHHVGRLEIAMHDAARVREGDGSATRSKTLNLRLSVSRARAWRSSVTPRTSFIT